MFCIIILVIDFMKNVKYERVANLYKPEEHRLRNAIIAFVVGGFVGFVGELIIEVLCKKMHISRSEASSFMIVFYIFGASLLTGIGCFDTLVKKCKCGLLIPITGFSHAMTSAALDYKNEGPVYGIGTNMFKLTGSVILYGVVFAWIFGMIRYFIGVIS